MPLGPKKPRYAIASPQPEPVVDSENERARDYTWLDLDDDDFDDFDEPDELDELDPDDPHWEVFLADDDELDPQPAPNDFWPAE